MKKIGSFTIILSLFVIIGVANGQGETQQFINQQGSETLQQFKSQQQDNLIEQGVQDFQALYGDGSPATAQQELGGQNPSATQPNRPEKVPAVSIELPNPLGVNSITGLLDRLIGGLFIIATPIAIIMIIIGAFQILTAAGDPEKVKKGKKTITYTVIGYAVIIVAKSVTVLIASILGVQGL